MFRNLFLMFASLSVGVTTASAAVTPQTDQSLDQRLQEAQKKIGVIMTGREMAAPPAAGEFKVAGGYSNWSNWDNWDKWHKWHKWHKWNNWDNWSNWHNSYSGGGSGY
jgi:hypothetical protein